MAKTANELNRKVLQNLRTTGSNEYIVEKPLSNIAAEGEVIVQMGSGSTAEEKKKATGLWTLASDGTTPVRFPSEERVEEMISTGASEDVEALSGTVQEFSAATVSAVTELHSEIDDEGKRALSAETILAKAVEAESQRAVSAETVLQGEIDAEEARAIDAEKALDDKIDELSAATIGEVARLDDRIDDVIAKAVDNEDGSINVVAGASGGTLIDVNIKSGEKVLAKAGGNGLYTDLDLVKIETGLPTNVKERYQLLATDDSQIGANIDIPKDSSLYRVYLGHVDDTLTSASDPTVISGSGDTALCFIYQLGDGTYDLVAIDVESFLEESEFKDGLQVINHEVSVKIDENSEDFLTVSEDGVKLDGVQAAIDDAVASATTELEAKIDAVDDKVDALSAATIAEVTRLDGEIDTEESRAKAAEEALDGVIGSVKAQEGETRTYGHSGTNYLDNNDQVKEDVETIDDLLGKVTGETVPEDNTVFTSGSSVAQNITDIKKKIAVLQGKSIQGKTNDYAEVEVTVTGDVTYIETKIDVQDIATASAATDGIATAYDVKQFAVSAVKDDAQHPTNVSIISEDGVKKLDLSYLSVDCGEF